MADTKISGLAAVTDVLATDEFVLARSGATKKIDAADLAVGLAASTAPGTELDYAQITSNATSTATTSATATAAITGNAVTYDGSTIVMIEFWAAIAEAPSNVTVIAVLYDGSTELAAIAYQDSGSAGVLLVPFIGKRRLTPTAGSHTYSIRIYGGAGTKTIYAGAGTGGGFMPAFLRIVTV